jgi:hypothetical protein
MGRMDSNENEGKPLYKAAVDIMANLMSNEVYLTPMQLILSHGIKCQLVELIGLLDERKIKKATRLLFIIETRLVSLFEENLRKQAHDARL